MEAMQSTHEWRCSWSIQDGQFLLGERKKGNDQRTQRDQQQDDHREANRRYGSVVIQSNEWSRPAYQ